MAENPELVWRLFQGDPRNIEKSNMLAVEYTFPAKRANKNVPLIDPSPFVTMSFKVLTN